MLVSNLTHNLTRLYGLEEAIRLNADAGFDAYDISLFALMGNEYPLGFRSENYVEYAKEVRAYADSLGIICNQSHAPLAHDNGDKAHDENTFNQIVKSLEIASILGAKIAVVHPKQHLPYGVGNNAQILKELNIEFYRSLLPYCEKYGIKVAVENMWQLDPEEEKYVVDSTCSRPEEFCEYVDAIGSEWVVACLDLGHSPIVGQDVPNMIKALGPRLQALHVHDNDLIGDLHLPPYSGKMDFDAICKALKEINYKGDITFECDGQIAFKYPAELVDSSLTHLCNIGKHLRSKIID